MYNYDKMSWIREGNRPWGRIFITAANLYPIPGCINVSQIGIYHLNGPRVAARYCDNQWNDLGTLVEFVDSLYKVFETSF